MNSIVFGVSSIFFVCCVLFPVMLCVSERKPKPVEFKNRNKIVNF
jgi:hypothetical protein